MGKTSIEWADVVWNPVTGCTKVSQGCKHCFAETMAKRFWKDRKFTDVQMHQDRMLEPMDWQKPSRVFVNSMSDLFHESVTLSFVARTISVMREAEQHTFMILTKRAERMHEFIDLYCRYGTTMPKNVWLGVSVENQEAADQRIPLLLQTPAARRFVSCEPLLGPVDIFEHMFYSYNELDGTAGHSVPCLDWVITGGESGPGARPMHPAWALNLRDQCELANVPFFFKQWGAHRPVGLFDGWEGSIVRLDKAGRNVTDTPGVWCESDQLMERCGKKAAGRLLDGREWNEVPER